MDNSRKFVYIVDLKPECFETYKMRHKDVPVESQLFEVGFKKVDISFWNSTDPEVPVRLIMTGLWAATKEGESFESAMERYQSLPGVKEWEEDMDKLKLPLPGCSGTRWQECSSIYNLES